jgi:hypothetical protein
MKNSEKILECRPSELPTLPHFLIIFLIIATRLAPNFSSESTVKWLRLSSV